MIQSQDTPPENLFSDSAYFICWTDKESKDIFFKCGWGQELEDIANFAFMLYKINNGEYEGNILDVLKRQTQDTNDLSVFMELYLKYKNDKDSDLVVPPSMVHLK
mgnify:CR=1 FL=1